jgi:hypothetical protein
VIYADFNGDEKKDFAVRGSDGIALLVGNGDGTFQSAAAYELGHLGTGLATADFNRDGNPDIAVAIGPGSTRVLLGNGDGTFSVGPDPAPGVANPFNDGGLFVGDLNGDGLADVLGIQNGARVQYGDGAGNLSAAINVANTSSVACCGAVGDFNNDGRGDVVVADVDHVYFLTNIGGGQFSSFTAPLADPYPPTVPPYYSYIQRAVSLGDFNGDGIVDAAVISLDNYTGVESLQILLGNGDGTFSLGQAVPSVASFGAQMLFLVLPKPFPMSKFAPVVADVNGDGKLDLILPDAGQIHVFYGNGDGTFQPEITMKAPTPNFARAAVADLNLDGIPDLVLSDFGEVSVLYGKKGGGFTTPANYAAGDWPGPVAITDINGDGAPDLVFGSGTDAVVLLNVPLPGSQAALEKLTVNPEPSAFGQPFTIAASIVPVRPKFGTPSGTVTFSVDEQVIAVVQLGANGIASTVDSQALAPGLHQVTAAYSGDKVFHAYAESVQHRVLGAPDQVALSGTPNPANLGQNVTFTAQVTGSGSGVPTGKVQFLFLDGVTPESDAALDSSGTATLTTLFVTPGPHRLKAVYVGDQTYSSGTSNLLTENINPGPGDFTIAVTPGSASILPRQSATFTVTMSSLYGFNQQVNLACTGAEAAGTTCIFNPNPVLVAPYLNIDSPPGTSTMTFAITLPGKSSTSWKTGSSSFAVGGLLAMALLFRRPRLWRRWGVWVVLLVFSLGSGLGCGISVIDVGTHFGTFSFNVTATAIDDPTVTHSVPVKITVH